jgi:hypothetical protein
MFNIHLCLCKCKCTIHETCKCKLKYIYMILCDRVKLNAFVLFYVSVKQCKRSIFICEGRFHNVFDNQPNGPLQKNK